MPNRIASPFGPVLWPALLSYPWIRFVRSKRLDGTKAGSLRVLTALQLLCSLNIGVLAAAGKASERESLATIAQVFELMIVGFHLIYFSLAWVIGISVPLHTYLAVGVTFGLLYFGS